MQFSFSASLEAQPSHVIIIIIIIIITDWIKSN
jgi:hypothetical protein